MNIYSRFEEVTAAQATLAALIEQLGTHLIRSYCAAKFDAQVKYSLSLADGDEENPMVVEARQVSSAMQLELAECAESALTTRAELELGQLELRVRTFIPGVRWCGCYTRHHEPDRVGTFKLETEASDSNPGPRFLYSARHPDDPEKPEKSPLYRIFLEELPPKVLEKLALAE